MDEGFTSYISDQAENQILEKELELPNRRAYRDYFRAVRSGKEEPLTTHADRFSSSRNYGMSSYDKGSYTFDSGLNPNISDSTNLRKVTRGGSWKDVAYFLEVSSRDYEYSDTARSYIGFRTVQNFIGTTNN